MSSALDGTIPTVWRISALLRSSYASPTRHSIRHAMTSCLLLISSPRVGHSLHIQYLRAGQVGTRSAKSTGVHSLDERLSARNGRQLARSGVGWYAGSYPNGFGLIEFSGSSVTMFVKVPAITPPGDYRVTVKTSESRSAEFNPNSFQYTVKTVLLPDSRSRRRRNSRRFRD